MIEYGICRTDECQNSGVPVAFTRAGDVDVTCGPCGHRVAEIVDTPPLPPTEVPKWLS